MSSGSIKLAGSSSRLATEKFTQNESGVDRIVDVQLAANVPIGQQPLPLVAFLESSGSVEAKVDGSSTAVEFSAAPGANEIWRVESIVIYGASSSSQELDEFGDQIALTNGCLLSGFAGETEIVDLLGSEPLKSNYDLDAIGQLDIGEGTASYTFKTTIKLSSPLRLEGGVDGAEESIRFTVRDDLTGLVRLRILALGAIESSLT